jgi:hypothetical protein
MQRRIYCFLFGLLIMNNLFSQSMRENIGEQFDKIASVPMKDKEFTISAFLGNRVYVLQKAKDSLLAFSYTTTAGDIISGACSILVNDDSLFLKAVSALFNDIKQNHNYQSYSKETLTNGNFFVTFNEKNKLQIVSRKEATPGQQKNMNFILGRLSGYSITPLGNGRKVKSLDVTSLNELLKYLK